MKEIPAPKKSSARIQYVVVFLFSLLLYSNTFNNDYNIDDDIVTAINPQIRKGFAAIPEILSSPYREMKGNTYGYRPVAKTTFAIEYQLFGKNPKASHVINALLYALACLITFRILRKLMKSYHPWIPLTAVLIFAAHPVHTEAVASLKNREEIISFILGMCSLSMIWSWFQNRKPIKLIGGILVFLLAVITKQSALSFILIIPLTVLFFSETSFDFLTNTKRRNLYLAIAGLFLYYAALFLKGLTPAIPGFILISVAVFSWQGTDQQKKFYRLSAIFGILFFVFAVLIRQRVIALDLPFNPIPYFAALIPFAGFAFRSRQLMVISSILVVLVLAGYLATTVPPKLLPEEIKTSVYYENPLFFDQSLNIQSAAGVKTLFSYLKLTIIPHPLGFYYGYNMVPFKGWADPIVIISLLLHLAMLAYAFLNFKRRSLIAYGTLFYFFGIILWANFILPINGIIAERLLFVASLGFAIAIPALLIERLSKSSPGKVLSPKAKNTFLIVSGIIILLFSIKTVNRNTAWKDRFTLFANDIEFLSESVKANEENGIRLMGEFYLNIQKHKNIKGVENNPREAIACFEKALTLFPEYKQAFNNIGAIYYEPLKDYAKAAEYFQKSVDIDSSNAVAWYNLACSYGKIKKDSLASHAFIEAIRQDKEKEQYQTGLVNHLKNINDSATVRYWYSKASEIIPANQTFKQNALK
ncbi:MAG: hypothetical protein KKA07_17420 [Bacteroidetes bacterium]|nr:hypothetical protein [Bacteroidota bacterium]MBU1720850.1 hypothetical protein [Bacteroidota bacterium]